MTHIKNCLQCGHNLKGRPDKKFCDDQCRSLFNNQLNSDVSSTMRNINYILRKNRRILAELIPDSGKIKSNRQELERIGFDFRYFTHHHQSLNGRQFTICYDYGYICMENDQLLLMQIKEKRHHRKIRDNHHLDSMEVLSESNSSEEFSSTFAHSA